MFAPRASATAIHFPAIRIFEPPISTQTPAVPDRPPACRGRPALRGIDRSAPRSARGCAGHRGGSGSRVVAFDFLERDMMHGLDLVRVRYDRGIRADPHHDRCNQIAGAGRIVVEQTEHVALAKFDTEL